ncbi:hypothetical protein AAY473_024684 [Plecturocebus cupreus]
MLVIWVSNSSPYDPPASASQTRMWLPNVNPEECECTFTFIVRPSRSHGSKAKRPKSQRLIGSDQQNVSVRLVPGSTLCRQRTLHAPAGYGRNQTFPNHLAPSCQSAPNRCRHMSPDRILVSQVWSSNGWLAEKLKRLGLYEGPESSGAAVLTEHLAVGAAVWRRENP